MLREREKNKIRAVFKLQFHATQVNQLEWGVMTVALVPLDIGKTTMRTDRVPVIDGSCYWRHPIYETVKLLQDPRTGKIHDKLYNFVVSANGSATAAIVGEACIDLSDYFEVVKPAYVSLALKPAKSGVFLHVIIQRMYANLQVRECEDLKDSIAAEQWTTNKHDPDMWDEDREAAVLKNSSSTRNGLSATNGQKKRLLKSKRTVYLPPVSSGNIEKSSSSNTISTAGSDCSEQHKFKGNVSTSRHAFDDSITSKSNNKGTFKKENTILDYMIMEYSEHQTSTNGWLASSVLDEAVANSNKMQDISEQNEKYGDQTIPQLEQMDLSQFELQNFIAMEGGREEIILRKMNGLKAERDALKRDYEELKALQRKIDDDQDDYNKLHPNGNSDIEEINQELQYERSLNSNLHLQLHKTQEANSELILAVQDLEELLEQKDGENICVNCSKNSTKPLVDHEISEMNFSGENSHVQVTEFEELFGTTSDGDDEQYQLEVLIKREDRDKAVHSMEQKIEDLNRVIDSYKTQQEDLQMKLENLSLDNENLRQQNMRHGCSENSATTIYHEEQIRILKKELQEQYKSYEASVEEIMKAKLEEEKRAAQAEDTLKLTISNNADIAERLQEEFITLAGEISSTFHMNEKLAIQAMTEANEIHLQKCHLENHLEKIKVDFVVFQHEREMKFMELSDLVDSKTRENERLVEKLKAKSEENDNQQKLEEENRKALKEEIRILETKVKMLSAEKAHLSEQAEQNRRSVEEMEKLQISNKETERKLQETILEREIIESELASIREKALKSEKDLKELQQQVQEKDKIIKNLNFEVGTLREESEGTKKISLADEMEKESLRKQVFHLQSGLREKVDKISSLEKKNKESARSANSEAIMKRAITENKTHKPSQTHKSQGSNEVILSSDKIKMVEANLMVKRNERDEARPSFLHKEKASNQRIEEVENGICQCNQMQQIYDMEERNIKNNLERESDDSIHNELALRTKSIPLQNKEESVSNNCGQENLPAMLNEMTRKMENSKAIEAELKEMQQRYTDISLRFAEVEGERQQLVMTVRNLKNAQKT
ncbi:hypothetical protein KSP40_PGU000381 [Platanthera guangdongensis]|uniref:C2 NT-type domain-containing protein n=1 Tax=Platanthera guangdongensis TaxID=2320717 RepID=A0ABR2LP66_9ASPA